MNPVDFSAKQSCLIRRPDGQLVPMDMPCYDVKEIAPGTWQIMSSGDYHYLLLGDDIGVSIDTGYGAGNLRGYLTGLCGHDVPWVINTHSHFDHTANNCYFDLAYMDRKAFDLASIPYPSFAGVAFPRDYPKSAIGDGDTVPLPGRELEIFQIGDHTADGIAILDRKERLLFTGDEIMLMGKTLNGSVEKWKADLEKLLVHRDEFDRIYGGVGEVPAEYLDIFHEAACRILAGSPSEPLQEMEAPPPLLEERGPEGQTVYDCKIPHPEDRPKGGFFKSNPNMVDYQWKGLRFSYDKTLLRAGTAAWVN